MPTTADALADIIGDVKTTHTVELLTLRDALAHTLFVVNSELQRRAGPILCAPRTTTRSDPAAVHVATKRVP